MTGRAVRLTEGNTMDQNESDGLPETITIAGVTMRRVSPAEGDAGVSWSAEDAGNRMGRSHVYRYGGQAGEFLTGKWGAWIAVGSTVMITDTEVQPTLGALDLHMRQTLMQAADELTRAAVALLGGAR